MNAAIPKDTTTGDSDKLIIQEEIGTLIQKTEHKESILLL